MAFLMDHISFILGAAGQDVFCDPKFLKFCSNLEMNHGCYIVGWEKEIQNIKVCFCFDCFSKILIDRGRCICDKIDKIGKGPPMSDSQPIGGQEHVNTIKTKTFPGRAMISRDDKTNLMSKGK